MKDTLDIFRSITDALLEAERTEPVAPYIPVTQLFDTVDLTLGDTPTPPDQWAQSVKDIVLASPRTASKGFFNQLFGGRNDKAILGELLTVILNNGLHSYKSGGIQIGVERVIVEHICKLVGWTEPAGGTMAPGGSITNLMALLMARDKAVETIKTHGYSGQKLTAYTSIESHYSIAKNAAFSGIGRDQVRYIATDAKGRMDANALRQQIVKDIDEGYTPFLLNLTTGTTVLGAFDPIRETVAVANNYGLWSHADGAYCGSVLWSDKYRHMLDGVELLDSFCVNPHKMMSVPLSCSILVVKDKKYLYDSFANDASYLYQSAPEGYSPGKTSMQCGRRNDAFKLWTLWKSVGTLGLAEIVDHEFALADTAREYVRQHPDYQLYSFDDSISVCFNYKDIPARELCTKLYEEAELMVGYGSFKGDEFVRLVTVNPANTKEDILAFFKKIEAFVNQHSF